MGEQSPGCPQQATGLSVQLATVFSDHTSPRPALRQAVLLSAFVAAVLAVSVLLQHLGLVTAHALLATPLAALAVAATLVVIRAVRQVARQNARHRLMLHSAEAVFEALAEGVAVVGPDGRVVACNSSAGRILGIPVQDLVGQLFESPAVFFLRDDGTPLEPEDHPVRVSLTTGEACRDMVVGIQKPDQRLLWLAVSAEPMRESGSPCDGCVVCTFSDVSERRQDQLALLAREAQLRHTLAGAPVVLWSADTHGLLDLVLGGGLPARSPEVDLIAQPATGLFPECPLFAEAVARAYAAEPSLCRSRFGDRVFETHVSPHREPNGDLVGISGISVDVTERVRAEVEQATLRDALQRAAQEWRTTFDTIESPVLVVGSDGKVRRANRAAQRLWGEPFDRVVGSLLPPGDRGAPWGAIGEAASRSLATGTPVAADESDTQGKRHWDVVAVPLTGETDVAQGIVAVARDVSRIVALQESLRHSERMSVLGQLVGGVAHQVRNPLFGISSTLDAFDVEFEGHPELAEYSKLLRHETNRLSRLMNDLLEYGKPAPVALERGALEAVLKSAVQATRAVADGAGVRVVMAADDPLPAVRMEPRRLEEAFHNLIENAIQHSPPHSEVRVWAQSCCALSHASVLCGVDDSGPGFRPDDLPRLFEPFFSRRSGGTGLGLSIAQRIVDEHMGSIAATNREGGGARVAINLPAIAATEEPGARDA